MTPMKMSGSQVRAKSLTRSQTLRGSPTGGTGVGVALGWVAVGAPLLGAASVPLRVVGTLAGGFVSDLPVGALVGWSPTNGATPTARAAAGSVSARQAS